MYIYYCLSLLIYFNLKGFLDIEIKSTDLYICFCSEIYKFILNLSITVHHSVTPILYQLNSNITSSSPILTKLQCILVEMSIDHTCRFPILGKTLPDF